MGRRILQALAGVLWGFLVGLSVWLIFLLLFSFIVGLVSGPEAQVTDSSLQVSAWIFLSLGALIGLLVGASDI